MLTLYVAVAGSASILRWQLAGVGVAGAVWAVWYSLVPVAQSLPLFGGTVLAELLLLLAWYNLLERLLRGPYLQSMPELVRRGVRWAWLVFVVLVAAALLGGEAVAAAVPLVTLVYIGLLTLALLAFVLTAQLYGEATVEPHPALRALCVAAGLASGSLAFVCVLMLLLPVLPGWLALLRSAALAAAAVLLAFSVQANPQWSLAIFVSPQARMYAPRLLAAAAVLLLVLLCLPLFAVLEPGLTVWLAPLLLAVVGGLITTVLFSEPLRAQLRVFVSKHFLPFRYDYREEWLRLIDTLAAPGQERPLSERAIQCLAQIVSSPAGLLWMREAGGEDFACVQAWNVRQLPEGTVRADDAVVRFMHERQWILDTAELQRRPDLYPGLVRPRWLDKLPDALLVVPLVSTDTVIGFVVLLQSSSAFRLTFEEIDLLRTSGRQVAAHLAQLDANRQLAEAKQFEAFNRLTAFVMHDLKNLIAQQSLMVKNAARHKSNPAFVDDMMVTVENSVARMQKLLQQLQHGDTYGPARRANLAGCVREALRKCAGREPEPLFSEPAATVEAVVDTERLTTILAHLIRNAQDATPADGKVEVRLSTAQARACILIADNGSGMDAEFVRQRLFRPFDTTKGSQGMGIGAYQARAYVTAAGGSLTVESARGAGTTVRILLPLAAGEAVVEVSD